jgi:hypothetical protein
MEEGKYVVFLFERQRNNMHKEKDFFYWITSIDSISKQGFNLFPLYLSDFTKSDLIKCSRGETINPYLINGDTIHDLDKESKSSIHNLFELISKNQTKIQSISKTWGKKNKETVNVYVTPITGNFFSCVMESFELIDYTGSIYLPASDFKIYIGFWDLPVAKNVISQDYSYFFFVNNSTGGSLKNLPTWKKHP